MRWFLRVLLWSASAYNVALDAQQHLKTVPYFRVHDGGMVVFDLDAFPMKDACVGSIDQLSVNNPTPNS